jgi:hypothetical protein
MIYGIGLGKTASVSLSGALKILKYSTIHFPRNMMHFNSKKEICIKLVGNYESYIDLPIGHFYKELDQNAKFILTVRDMDSWLKSCKKFFYPGRFDREDPILSRLQEVVYGSDVFNEDKYRAAYTKHLNDVMDYFKDKDNLLVMDICAGDGWEKLCPFLNQPIPTNKFPHFNKAPSNVK